MLFCRTMLLILSHGQHDFTSSVHAYLHSVRYDVPPVSDSIPPQKALNCFRPIFRAVQSHPMLLPFSTITRQVTCTYEQSLSQSKKYCHLPVPGSRVLQFRLGSHNLPVVADRFAGDDHLGRAQKFCTCCESESRAVLETSNIWRLDALH